MKLEKAPNRHRPSRFDSYWSFVFKIHNPQDKTQEVLCTMIKVLVGRWSY